MIESDQALQYVLECLKNPACKSKQIGVLGSNEWATDLHRFIEFDFIVDDYASEQYFNFIPIISSKKIPLESTIVNCSMLHTVDAARQIVNNGGLPVSYYRLISSTPEDIKIKPVWYWNHNFSHNVRSLQSMYDALELLLCNQRSKKVLNDLYSFRSTGSIRSMSDYTDKQSSQYFENFCLPPNYPSNSTFLDVGAFDGETSLQFAKYFKSYESIHCFEPSPSNFNKLKKNINSLRSTFCYNVFVSNANEQRFVMGEGSTALVVEKNIGNNTTLPFSPQINSLIIDDLNFDAKSHYFLKIDTEGFESNVLAGATNFIYDCRPIIACAVYHKPQDLFDIKDQILSIRRDYSIYLEHYTQGFMETIMYFVPHN